jgi:hypothetical protein
VKIISECAGAGARAFDAIKDFNSLQVSASD